MTQFPGGVITASLTPMDSDLKIDFAKLVAHCEWLLQNGSQGLALLGTTGEANSFSIQERVELLEEMSNSGIPLNLTMVGTGCTAYPDTIYFTKRALDLGYCHSLMLPPFFYKQIDDRGLFAYFEKIISEINSDQLKIYLYHFPKMSGVRMTVEFVQELVDAFPNTIVGMKDSSGDLENMRNIRSALPGFRLYAGTERFLLDMLRIDGAGCISATANVTSRYAGRVFEAHRSGDAEVQKLQDDLISIRSCFEGLPFTAALKQVLAKYQMDSSWTNLRPPNSLLNEETIVTLLTQLKQTGFNSI